MGNNRWEYMRMAGYNPPSDDCPTCLTPSKVWHAGASTKDGVTSTDWLCEYGHRWTTTELVLANPQAR